jgi:RNA polymerase sigma factor (sigma-70 family)
VSASPADQVPAPRHGEYEAFFRQMFRPLVALGLSLGGFTLEEAEDAAEAALEEVLQRWPSLTNPQGFAYKAIASNLMKIRRKQASQHRAMKKARGDFQPEAHEDPGLAAVEFRQWAMSLISSLPPAQRDAAACCFIDGLTPAEAARLLGKTGPALRQALHAARKALQSQLDTPAGLSPKTGTSTVYAAVPDRKEVQ